MTCVYPMASQTASKGDTMSEKKCLSIAYGDVRRTHQYLISLKACRRSKIARFLPSPTIDEFYPPPAFLSLFLSIFFSLSLSSLLQSFLSLFFCCSTPSISYSYFRAFRFLFLWLPLVIYFTRLSVFVCNFAVSTHLILVSWITHNCCLL